MFTILPSTVWIRVAHPTEQNGQMLGVVLASLIRSSCARAMAGASVTPSPTSPPMAVPAPARGYVRELRGVVGGTAGPRPALIACRRQQAPVGRAAVESLREHVKEAEAEAGVLFAAADFDPDALTAAHEGDLALLRVTDGRSAFDTSGWGAPGHYPAWLPAYCAQTVTRDPLGQPRYRLLEPGQGDQILHV